MSARPHSLRRNLIRRLMAAQAIALLALATGLAATGQLFDIRSADATIERLRDAVIRDESGALRLQDTPNLRSLRAEIPDLWFTIRDRSGQRLAEGVVPPEYATLGDALDRVGQARLGWRVGDPDRPIGRMRWVDTRAGEVQILTGSEAPLPLRLVGMSAALLLVEAILPILLAVTVATLVVTPFVVRSALAGLDRAAAQATRISGDRRGTRLPLDGVPREVEPLVAAVNDALTRLDESHVRDQRFLLDAAHELRTPIAILSTRIASLPRSPEKTRLEQDVMRLTTLAEQLLDLQRLDRDGPLLPVDLPGVARQVVSDMAPLAFAAGYDMAFDDMAVGETARAGIVGDRAALERALTNLVQNAIDHGGGRGTITVQADSHLLRVRDQGSGIPVAERDRVLDPFYRLHPHGRGAGLGLDLVREIMRRHQGRVEVGAAPDGGASIVLHFPARRA